jgi:hypothetical protein
MVINAFSVVVDFTRIGAPPKGEAYMGPKSSSPIKALHGIKNCCILFFNERMPLKSKY